MKLALALSLLFLSTSCASILTGGTDDILVTSAPSGAYFSTNLGHTGRTPATISVSDDDPLAFSFDLDGYEDGQAHVGTRLSAWVWGNIVFGGLIGLVIDVVGDGNVHDDDHVHVELRPVHARVVATRGEVVEEPTTESFEDWERRKKSETAPAEPRP